MSRLKIVYIALGVGMVAAIVVAISVTLVEQNSSNSSSVNTSDIGNSGSGAPSIAPAVPSASPSIDSLVGSTPSSVAPSLRGSSEATSLVPSLEPSQLPSLSPSQVPSLVPSVDGSIAPTATVASETPSLAPGPPVSSALSDAPSTLESPSSVPTHSMTPTATGTVTPTNLSPSQSPVTASPSDSTLFTSVPTFITSGSEPTADPLSISPSLTPTTTTSRITDIPSTLSPTELSTTAVPSTSPFASTSPSSTPVATDTPGLTAPATGTFKILQLTDLHLGESPELDDGTWSVLQTVLPDEQPDLLVLSGDIISANVIDENATAYYNLLGNRLSQYNTPWAILFGESDDAPFEGGAPAKTSRASLVATDQQFPLSLTQAGPSNVFGTSNYVLPIYNSQGNVAAQLILLDTGGGSLPQQLLPSQVTWFQEERVDSVPALVFQHIPTNQQFVYSEDRCVGLNGDGRVDALVDGGDGASMMNALESDGNVWVVAVGHNHGNGYCCSVDGVSFSLCFGRHTGYGGYSGAFGRGARVFEVEFANDVAVGWTSWVRMEYGFSVDVYSPSS